MGVSVVERKLSTPIPAAKLFKAIVTDGQAVLPTTVPNVFQNIETVQGSGGPGTVKKITYAQGSGLNYAKNRIDAIDHQNYVYQITTLEGEPWIDTIEKVSLEVKIEPSGDGGSVFNGVMKFYPKGSATISDAHIKAEVDKIIGMFKTLEQSLLANPNAY
ncbi:hypothetical protein JCGZ_10695 [Jatropha curcas]|uniref:Bet v I/Major latex protein domain-containing protein n=1 Tax=Jatropha curcas TaxID=180498 RepID=A0A067KG06_JATCU|nr:major allergen Mal d 1 [Jatropha curcas]KDP35161.1 hypothetical protein JCGZ_10695 [Jatropha curcas]